MKTERSGSLMHKSLAVALLVSCMSGCGRGEMGEQFRRLQGPPHQRLNWKAEDFFTDAGVLSLCKAIEAKDTQEIGRLVKSGVDINAKGRGNMTPLMWAFPMGEEVFKKVLELGADPNVQLTETLTLGGFKEDRSVVSASIDLADGIVHKQYFHDVNMDNYLSLVLRHGGNPNLVNANGDTMFVYAMYGLYRPRAFRLLVDAGGDINHRNRRGETPVMLAIRSYDYMLALLDAGADYRIVDNRGWDLILWLEWHRRPERVPVITAREAAQAKPVFDWLAKEGVNWEAARVALKSRDLATKFKGLPADYKHRPWLPQRPTLKKPRK